MTISGSGWAVETWKGMMKMSQSKNAGSRRELIKSTMKHIEEGGWHGAGELKKTLGAKRYSELRQQIERERPILRPYIAAEIARYEQLLRDAGRRYAHERTTNQKPTARVGLRAVRNGMRAARRTTAEGAYEKAAEKLEEMLEDDPGLAAYFDRPTTRDECQLYPGGMPLPHTSRSPHRRISAQERDAVMQALKGALEKLEDSDGNNTLQKAARRARS